jgi:hypothetical protein
MHPLYDNFMMLCVLFNTAILATPGFLSPKGEVLVNNMNFAFTIIFTIDMGLKLIAMGVLGYLRDKSNVFDGLIVILSLLELVFLNSGSSAISAFRSFRIFRLVFFYLFINAFVVDLDKNFLLKKQFLFSL